MRIEGSPDDIGKLQTYVFLQALASHLSPYSGRHGAMVHLQGVLEAVEAQMAHGRKSPGTRKERAAAAVEAAVLIGAELEGRGHRFKALDSGAPDFEGVDIGRDTLWVDVQRFARDMVRAWTGAEVPA